MCFYINVTIEHARGSEDSFALASKNRRLQDVSGCLHIFINKFNFIIVLV